ncbi:phage portal protein, lambda family [Buttiauxella agrestis]|uniref:Phage portal protein, lambda family n=1 Tax=Buttiauxella agrestis TaxID=82977 RepID=A0A381C647_9ENTR|nr:phage portal protein [Buttiauxella agrestis]SUW63287.1 phage portal protein, lambda family [Buttiauxella agrestis]
MNLITKAVSLFSPGWAARRLRAEIQVQAYEAARPTRTHAARRESRSANTAIFAAGASIREQARWLDENHDIAIGILDKLEERVVGARGIQIEPQPLSADGKVHEQFAALISAAWERWAESPEVTGSFSLAEAERLMLRSAVRDGEVFTQLIRGPVKGVSYNSNVQFSFEMLEADFVPLNLTGANEGFNTIQGVNVNAWGRALSYNVYKFHPQSGLGASQTKIIPAERMLHLAMRKRLHQVRGMSIFAGVLQRLSDVKEYEDSERIAARIAASLGFFIKRGDGSVYADDASDWQKPDKENRDFEMSAGMIYDGLAPGEELEMLESNRPNTNMLGFRSGQLRAAAAGTRTGYSSIARDYNGTYSAQRQELVESFEGYGVLQEWFVSRTARPLYREWLKMFLLSGVEIPSDIDPDSLYNATYMAPVMPWIDPVKEGDAWKTQIRGGAATEAEWIRARGLSPRQVKSQRMREIDFNRDHDLVFDTDPANDKGSTPNEQATNNAGGTASQRPDPGDE